MSGQESDKITNAAMLNDQVFNNVPENSPLLNNQTAETSQEAFNTWIRFMDIVKLNVSDLKLNTWFKPIKPVSLKEGTLTISVPSQDYYEMIISRFGEIVNRAIRSILGNDGRLVYEIDPRTTFSQEPELIDTPPPTLNSVSTGNALKQPAFDPNFYRPGITSVPVTPENLPDDTKRWLLNP